MQKNILVNADELDVANHCIRYVKSMWDGVTMKTFTMQSSLYGPHQRAYDLFGDDSVILVSTPGHT